ncbi:MAG: PAS domain S-box protein [Planctomycetia bacterium]|nr:PAS domain S-box protein [Planctomycetia bacterium]
MEPGRLLSALLEHSADAFSMLDAGGRILYVSPASLRQIGFRPEELVGSDPFALVHPDDLPDIRQRFETVLAEPGGIMRAEFRMRRREGGWSWIEATARNMLAEPSVAAVIINSREVGWRREAEAALRASEERLRAVVTQSAIVLWAVDMEGVFTLSEGSGLAALGLLPGQVVGRSAFEIYAGTPELGRHIRLALEGSPSRAVVDVAGRVFDAWFGPLRDGGGAIVGATGVASDVTETRRLQEQFLQAQKMEGLGRLAGGVAHDFNNLLTAVLGFNALLLKRHPPGDPDRPELEEIRKAGERAAALTKQLLAFSRRQVVQSGTVDLNAVVDDMRGLLARLIGEDVVLDTRPLPSAAWVRADRSQLEQVIVNLAVNARDAMPGGGRLLISTTRRTVAEEATDPSGLPPGRWIGLDIADNGHGMPDDVRMHAFEPFFTTKGPGRGTGLGLATVYGIVSQSGGVVRIESEPGRGTTVSIWLPEVPPAPRAASEPPSSAPRGRETILLVEDEPSVLDLCRLVLLESGYRLLEATSGLAALNLLSSSPDPVHLLLSDVVLPGMNGPDLARRAAALRPGLRVLFITGYSADETAPGPAPVLPKPFSPDDLARRVRSVLDGAAAPP